MNLSTIQSPETARPQIIGPVETVGRCAPPSNANWAQVGDLRQAFVASGGVIDSEELVGRLRSETNQPIAQVARWIVDRHIVNFEACGLIWLPLFQFEPHCLILRDEVRRAIDELVHAFDDRAIAQWFSSPSASLRWKSPAEAVCADPGAAFEAARLERFLAT